MSRIGRFLLVGVFLASCASADKPEAPPRPTREVSAAGAQLRGGGIRMDVQIGRGQTKRPGKAGAIVVTPHAVVAP
jgi:hypothetical protein